MKNKENVVGISSLIYLILLGLLFISSLISGILKLEITKILLLIFVGVGIIGYIIIAVIRIKTYEYVCVNCKEKRSIGFFEYLFSKKADDDRFLACDKCKDITRFKRQVK